MSAFWACSEMASTDHWMRFNVGDYLADTMHLSTFQHGCYIMLIMHYFKRGELPDDERALARIAKTSLPQWHRQCAPVMALFGRHNGGWVHRRIDAERERARNVSEVKQAAGKQGASRRWGMAHANGEDGICHSDEKLDSRERAAARATEPDLEIERGIENPPYAPPQRGGRRGREFSKTPPTKNYMTTIAADMIADEAEMDDDRVVPLRMGAIR